MKRMMLMYTSGRRRYRSKTAHIVLNSMNGIVTSRSGREGRFRCRALLRLPGQLQVQFGRGGWETQPEATPNIALRLRSWGAGARIAKRTRHSGRVGSATAAPDHTRGGRDVVSGVDLRCQRPSAGLRSQPPPALV